MPLFRFLLLFASIITSAHAFELTEPVKNFCNSLSLKFTAYKWGEVGCENYNWNHVRNSNLGTPLIWTVFGDENSRRRHVAERHEVVPRRARSGLGDIVGVFAKARCTDRDWLHQAATPRRGFEV